MKQRPNHFKSPTGVGKACRLDGAAKASLKSKLVAAVLPNPMSSVPGILWYGTVTLVACLVLGGVMAGQDRPTGISSPVPQLPDAVSAQLKAPLLPVHPGQTVNPQQVGGSRTLVFPAVFSRLATAQATGLDEIRRITLQEAQQMAAGASNPMVRLGELQVEAAKQHRLGLQGLYFPNLGAQFDNLHFNKNPGQVATFEGPLGNQHTVAANVFNKNETVVNLSAVQPVTPLMAIHQLVKIARADENIARSKAGMPVAEIAGKVEQNYFELLVAQQELISAEAESQKLQGKWLTASVGATSI